MAIFYYHFYQPIEAIEYATKAKEFFIKAVGYEKNVASCESVLGAAFVYLKQYEASRGKI